MLGSDDREQSEVPVGADQATAKKPLSLNALFELLAHHYRRDILQYLSTTPNQSADINEIVDYLSDRVTERVGTVPSRNNLKVEVYQQHLPKLAAADLITYECSSKKIYYTANAQTEEFLDTIFDTVLDQSPPYEDDSD